MNCPHCFEPVEEQSAFCPHCGVRLVDGDDPAAVGLADDPTFGALARANLLRLRGDWEAARSRTVEVLRGYPNSGTAHSLMGDIHADQGMYEEAAQWYRMALDLEPDNAADARKLDSAQAMVRERAAALEGTPLLEEARERAPRLSPLLLAGWAAAAFLVIVIALGLWINSQRPGEDAPVVQQPPAAPGAEVGPGPAIAPPAIPEPSPDAPAPSAPPADTAPAVPPPVRTAPQPTPGEVDLLDAVRRSPALATAGLAAVDAQTDPRGPSATVTLDGGRVDGAAADWMVRLHNGAVSAAQAALSADSALQRVTVRVVMPLDAGTEVIRAVAFIGEMDRADPAKASFDRRSWHIGLAPPPAIAGAVHGP